MARHLSSTDIKTIINFIYGTDLTPLTWENICEWVIPLVGKRFTRQTLNAHGDISSAYRSRKQSLRQTVPRHPKPASLSIASQRIRRLEAEVTDLKMQNSLLLEQFVMIQYNAYKHGLKESQLTLPLPRIDRERTDDH
ncbi:hypothetical protein [Pseudomonas viridiflava]|uniref:hypothetical protein n=1 Tax=Pseudomonas viridiflava TaxID=33069 RepID=UPI000F04C106|nr:hypothetical protein [Pseudomonas viridiflava]